MKYAQNRPPKNRISCATKNHMPRVEASCCWPMSSKWCCRNGWWWTGGSSSSSKPGCCRSYNVGLLGILRLFHRLEECGVVVRFPGDDRGFVEVLLRRRRRRGPFQSDCAPRIRTGLSPELERPGQIDERQEVTDSEHRRTGGREHV